MDNFVYIGMMLIVLSMGLCLTLLFHKVSLFLVDARSNYYKTAFEKKYQREFLKQFVAFFVITSIGFIGFISFSNYSSDHKVEQFIIHVLLLFITGSFYIASLLHLREGLRIRRLIKTVTTEADMAYQPLLATKQYYFHALGNALVQVATYMFFGKVTAVLLLIVITHMIYLLLSVIKYVDEPYIGEEIMAFIIKSTVAALVAMSGSMLILGTSAYFYFILMSTQALAYFVWSGCLLFLILSDSAHIHYKNSVRDSLTGIYNRRYFVNRLKQVEMHKKQSHQEVYTALIICDIDDFKKINDKYGHDIGDLAIAHFAKMIKTQVRQGDIVARIGGEEFAIILPDTEISTAQTVADRMCIKLQNTAVTVNTTETNSSDTQTNITFNITGSFGVAAHSFENTDTIIKNADAAMYQAKQTGKNKVAVYHLA